jgi:hypothetical protein
MIQALMGSSRVSNNRRDSGKTRETGIARIASRSLQPAVGMRGTIRLAHS